MLIREFRVLREGWFPIPDLFLFHFKSLIIVILSAWLTVISTTTPYCFLVNPFIKYSSLQLSCLSLKSTFWHKTCSVTKSDTWTIKLERFRKFRIHSSLVDWVIYYGKKPIPLASFYCIFHLVWIPMTTTQNIRGYRGVKKLFSWGFPF